MPQMNIDINGQPYVIACNPGEEDRLLALAAIVDEHVRRLAENVGQIGESKLLLMAAILLADELTEGQGAEASDAAAVRALESAAARIEDIAADLERPYI